MPQASPRPNQMRALRQLACMSLHEMAEIIARDAPADSMDCPSARSLKHIESGRSEPIASHATAIGRALRRSVEEVFPSLSKPHQPLVPGPPRSAREALPDAAFEARAYPQVDDPGVLEALRDLRPTVAALLSATAGMGVERVAASR